MIVEQYYLSETANQTKFLNMTDLSLDELTDIVGKFRKNHYRFAGKLKGEVYIYIDGKIQIRHHFTKKIIWEDFYEI